MGFDEVAALAPDLRQLLRNEKLSEEILIDVAQAVIELDAREAGEGPGR